MASYHLSVKSGKRGKASEHAAYIAREGRYGKNDKGHDLITKEHGNLPEWANNNPSMFWKMADENERLNGAAYRELEVALPLELTTSQNVELVKELVKQEVGEKTYQFAIHSPKAALGETKQPHAHIMFSDRKPDGIDRSAAQHFKRYNPDMPELGGCKKDSGGKDRRGLKEALVTTRKGWADLQNKFLEKHGQTATVDHRANIDRGIESEAERHLGHIGIKQMNPEDKLAYQAKRQFKKASV